MNNKFFIPCEKNIHTVSAIVWISWKERLVVERLGRNFKVADNKKIRNKINAEAFAAIAKSVPNNILAKHKNNINQLEALLIGQAGLPQYDVEEDLTGNVAERIYFSQKEIQIIINKSIRSFFKNAAGKFFEHKACATCYVDLSITSSVLKNH
jgi:uncharacterized protein DUF2851